MRDALEGPQSGIVLVDDIDAGLRVVDRCGMVFNPLGWSWSLSPRDLSVNYILTAQRA